MSFTRQQRMSVSEERFYIVRSMVVECAPGVRTTSATQDWHRLVATSGGVMIVGTPQGTWSTPPSNAVWVPAGIRNTIETCGETSLRVLYIRPVGRRLRSGRCGVVAVRPMLREIISNIAAEGVLDRRIAWQVALRNLLLHEVEEGMGSPDELVWPADERAARVASLLQRCPGEARTLAALCKGQGVSSRTVQRLFPIETGMSFEEWRARCRFLHASRLLGEEMKVSAIATACGYRSASAFVAAFKKFAGVTPGEFVRGKEGRRGRKWVQEGRDRAVGVKGC